METVTPTWLSHQIVQHTQEGIIFADRDGVIQLWNAGAETLFGYSASEATGQSLDLISPSACETVTGRGIATSWPLARRGIVRSCSRCQQFGRMGLESPSNLPWSSCGIPRTPC